ncbi:hypothetical protein DW143_14975 [Bacillus sonorensis]|nr:hypothetical protein DW143_14975 [Bacillus sonorensis]
MFEILLTLLSFYHTVSAKNAGKALFNQVSSPRVAVSLFSMAYLAAMTVCSERQNQSGIHFYE